MEVEKQDDGNKGRTKGLDTLDRDVSERASAR